MFVSNYNNKTYLLEEERFWRFDETNMTMDTGYPKDMSAWRNVPYPVNAAIVWKGGKNYKILYFDTTLDIYVLKTKFFLYYLFRPRIHFFLILMYPMPLTTKTNIDTDNNTTSRLGQIYMHAIEKHSPPSFAVG